MAPLSSRREGAPNSPLQRPPVPHLGRAGRQCGPVDPGKVQTDLVPAAIEERAATSVVAERNPYVDRRCPAFLREPLEGLRTRSVGTSTSSIRPCASWTKEGNDGLSPASSDILAEDDQGSLVVIELKISEAPDSAIAQVLSYIGSLQTEEDPRAVRGILIARDFTTRVRLAARAAAIQLVEYGFNFSFAPVDAGSDRVRPTAVDG